MNREIKIKSFDKMVKITFGLALLSKFCGHDRHWTHSVDSLVIKWIFEW